MAAIGTIELMVPDSAIDANGHVNNVVYVGWLQDAGTAHWNARFDEATRAKWSWVATRHEIDYLRGIEPGAEGVVARTWVGDRRDRASPATSASRTPRAASAPRASPNGCWWTLRP